MSQEPSVSESSSIYKIISKSIGTIVLLILIICLFLLLKWWQPWQPVDRTVQMQNVQTVTSDKSEEEIHYEFYDLLTKQQVSPVPEKPLVMANDSGYQSKPSSHAKIILVTQGLDNADLTDRQRNKIQMAGFASDVIIEQDHQGNKIYRVIAGPFDSKQQAQQAKQNLHQRGIDTVVSTFKSENMEQP